MQIRRLEQDGWDDLDESHDLDVVEPWNRYGSLFEFPDLGTLDVRKPLLQAPSL